MRAVNLIPPEFRPRVAGEGDPRIAYGVVGGLGLLFVMVLLSIMQSNKLQTIEDETAAINAQVQQKQLVASAFAVPPDQIGGEVKKRSLLVGGLASLRFPWGSALYNLSESLPDDVTLTTINATSVSDAAPATTPGAAPTGSHAGLTLEGCTSGWMGYSRFINWLETMPGVESVKSNNSSIEAAAGGSADAADGEGISDSERIKNCGPAPLKFGLSVSYDERQVDLVGLPKPDGSAEGASGATGAVPSATPAPAAAPAPAPES